MRFLSTKRVVPAVLVAGLCLCASAPALAQNIDCTTVGGPTAHRVYLTGSTAIDPLMATVGATLAALPTPIYLVYQRARGSCDGVHAAFDSPPAPLAGTAIDYDPATPTNHNCDFTTPVAADVGLSDVYPDSCDDFSDQHTLPAGVGDFHGPNQVMTFVVPKNSSQRVISHDAAYIIYGFGGNTTTVSPWTDNANIFQRSAASGTQSMLARAIGVPPARWRGTGVLNAAGTAAGGSGDMRRYLENQNSNALAAEKSIGILGTDIADTFRSTIWILAYQHTGQSCAYWPDSTVTAFDKINVRDGHYPIWGPVHMLAAVGADGRPTNPDVAVLMDYLAAEGPPLASLKAQVDAFTVPQCAMKVQRSSEVGPYMPYKPSKPCGCYFEKQRGGTATCDACDTDGGTCGAGKVCSYGYCEVM